MGLGERIGYPGRTGEHGDFVNVLKFSKVFAVETCPEVCDENLGPLVQSHLAALEDCLITEAFEILG